MLAALPPLVATLGSAAVAGTSTRLLDESSGVGGTEQRAGCG